MRKANECYTAEMQSAGSGERSVSGGALMRRRRSLFSFLFCQTLFVVT